MALGCRFGMSALTVSFGGEADDALSGAPLSRCWPRIRWPPCRSCAMLVCAPIKS
jgi:hypothetical protein